MTQRDLCDITKAEKSQRSQLRHSTELWYNKLMIREGQNLTLNPQYLAGFKENFKAFYKVAKIIKQRRHLAKEEIEKIRKIRESVKNKKRINL